MSKLILALILTISLGVVFGIMIVKSIQFDQSCGGYLERAASANTVEIAKGELQRALFYIETEDLTSGYTSVLWKTPDEDLGFWYNNIKTSYNELLSLPENASPLEKSNMLLKLRETLIDHKEKGDSITVPGGISRYPNNGIYGTLAWNLLIATVVAWFAVAIHYEP
jgi:hypothetical protein